MSNKFLVKKDLVDVEVCYVELEDDEIAIITDEEEISNLKDKIKIAKAKFCRPSWSAYNKYLKGSIVMNPETNIPMFDTVSLRDKRLRTLLKELIDGDGKRVILNSDFFDDLLPSFAMALIESFDRKVESDRQKVLFADEDIKREIERSLKSLNQENSITAEEKTAEDSSNKGAN